MNKQRLDCKMVELGLAESREKAKALIVSGMVKVDGKSAKPSDMVEEERIELKAKLPFVSRGGLKLQKALDCFDISVNGLVCLDVGASTGGFTDCMLQRGAKRVFALDVGYGQLDWRLRSDERVVALERRNARYMRPEWFPEAPGFASMDVSFISVGLILPALYECLTEAARAVVLIKPQFEAGRGSVGKKGVVSDPKVHLEVVEKVCGISRDIGFCVADLNYSPVKGPEGNIEYLLSLRKGASASAEPDAAAVISRAHENLSRN